MAQRQSTQVPTQTILTISMLEGGRGLRGELTGLICEAFENTSYVAEDGDRIKIITDDFDCYERLKSIMDSDEFIELVVSYRLLSVDVMLGSKKSKQSEDHEKKKKAMRREKKQTEYDYNLKVLHWLPFKERRSMVATLNAQGNINGGASMNATGDTLTVKSTGSFSDVYKFISNTVDHKALYQDIELDYTYRLNVNSEISV